MSPSGSISPALTCSIRDYDLYTKAADQLINQAMGDSPEEVSTKHAVMVVPSAPLLAGGRKVAKYIASLPREIKDGQSVTAFTKFVVVGHGEHTAEPIGISLGDDVCGGKGFCDMEAVRTLRTSIKKQLGTTGPRFLKCKVYPGDCPERSSPMVEMGIGFMNALSHNGVRGNIIPIMMQSQSPELGVALGDALALLIASGGAWQKERVLFLFPGDLSGAKNRAQAQICDTRTLEVVTGQGAPQIVRYLADLWAGKIMKGDCNKESVPRSYGGLLAAARVANSLGLKQRKFEIMNTRDNQATVGGDDLVMGYSTVLFWQDEGLPGEKLGAQQPPALLLAQHLRKNRTKM